MLSVVIEQRGPWERDVWRSVKTIMSPSEQFYHTHSASDKEFPLGEDEKLIIEDILSRLKKILDRVCYLETKGEKERAYKIRQMASRTVKSLVKLPNGHILEIRKVIVGNETMQI